MIWTPQNRNGFLVADVSRPDGPPQIEDYKILKSSCPATGTIAGTAYAYCGNNWWSYDTPATIATKMAWAKNQSLGGAFFWEFSGDTSNGELVSAISGGLA